MGKIYGYARVSRKQQQIDRQLRNIRAAFPEAILVQETGTGTRLEGRTQFEKLLQTVRSGDTIVFDSVSRMSRSAAEGFALYEQLYARGVELVFLKERHIDTATYKSALSQGVQMTGTSVDLLLEGVNRYLLCLCREQIALAFAQAQKEVDDLRQRTREGLETARLNGRQIGQQKGRRLSVKKAAAAKAQIRKYSRAFDGTNTDAECIKLIGLARNTYYKYKKELLEELSAGKGVP